MAYREDVDEVMAILREIDADMRADPDYGKDMLEHTRSWDWTALPIPPWSYGPG